MPFGIRKPFEYTRHGRVVIHPETYDECPICGRPINTSADGIVPVAPCLFPHLDLPDYELTLILGCSSCYQAQKRLGFNTVEELTSHRVSKKPAAVRAPRVKRPYVREPKVRSESHMVHRSLSDADTDLLSQAYELIGRILGRSASVEVLGRPDTEESSMSRSVMSQGLPDDDIEFGMTDEQRSRMDKAVHNASERTKLVPSEAWNGLTAAEVLKLDNNGVPNGW